jgi:hypothetical protein
MRLLETIEHSVWSIMKFGSLTLKQHFRSGYSKKNPKIFHTFLDVEKVAFQVILSLIRVMDTKNTFLVNFESVVSKLLNITTIKSLTAGDLNTIWYWTLIKIIILAKNTLFHAFRPIKLSLRLFWGVRKKTHPGKIDALFSHLTYDLTGAGN